MTTTRRYGWIAFLVVALGPNAGLTDDSVSIDLVGRIRPNCSVNLPSSEVNLGDMLNAGVVTIPFRVFCNAPFAYEIRSQSGGHKHIHAANAPRHFKAIIPYSVKIQIPTSVGNIDDTCSSRDLTTTPVRCRLSDSGSGISVNRDATLTLSWDDDKHTALAGTYRDVIILKFKPRF